MALITVYLRRTVKAKARKAARSAGLSLSEWVAGQITQSVAQSWPAEFLAAAGACPDSPSLEEIRSGQGQDGPRERFPK